MKTLGKKRYKFEEILVSSILQIFDGIREIIMYSKKEILSKYIFGYKQSKTFSCSNKQLLFRITKDFF